MPEVLINHVISKSTLITIQISSYQDSSLIEKWAIFVMYRLVFVGRREPTPPQGTNTTKRRKVKRTRVNEGGSSNQQEVQEIIDKIDVEQHTEQESWVVRLGAQGWKHVQDAVAPATKLDIMHVAVVL